MLRNIDAIRETFARFRREAFIACGIAVFAVIYLFSFNRNLLYLSLLFALYSVSLALFTRFNEMLVGLIVCTFLAAASVNISAGKFVDTRIEDKQVPYAQQPKPLEIWRYTFEVNDLEKYRQECGGNLQGRLLIDGLDLSGLEIDIKGDASAGSAQIIPKYGLDQIQMPITIGASKELAVLLHAKTGMSPKIYLGPESHGFDIYSDAGWLEFKNERCTVLYNAQRRVLPTE